VRGKRKGRKKRRKAWQKCKKKSFRPQCPTHGVSEIAANKNRFWLSCCMSANIKLSSQCTIKIYILESCDLKIISCTTCRCAKNKSKIEQILSAQKNPKSMTAKFCSKCSTLLSKVFTAFRFVSRIDRSCLLLCVVDEFFVHVILLALQSMNALKLQIEL